MLYLSRICTHLSNLNQKFLSAVHVDPHLHPRHPRNLHIRYIDRDGPTSTPVPSQPRKSHERDSEAEGRKVSNGGPIGIHTLKNSSYCPSLSSVPMGTPCQEMPKQYLYHGGGCQGGGFCTDCRIASPKATSVLEAGMPVKHVQQNQVPTLQMFEMGTFLRRVTEID